jgi:hypothetical protein
MARFGTKNLIVAANIAVLAITVSVVLSQRQAVAQNPNPGATVTIAGPLPLPVTGSATVSGSVAATQSGTWNVGISGTPSVAVSSLPSTPLLTKATDNPGLKPFQAFSTEQGAGLGGAQGLLTFYVPANSRLVIEQVSALCYLPDLTLAGILGGFRLDIHAGDFSQIGPLTLGFAEFELPVQQNLIGQEVMTNVPLRAYADSGSQVSVHISGQFPTGSHCAGALSGHLVSVP